MNEKGQWRQYRNRYLWNRIINVVSRKILHKEIRKNEIGSGKKLICQQTFTQVFQDAINSSRPFMVARYGSVEAAMMFMSLGVRCNAITVVPKKNVLQLHKNAGFFPLDSKLLNQYVDLMLACSKEVDILGYWNTGYQEYLVDKCCSKNVILTDLAYFQPYQAKDSNVWTASLAGKKVVVIHPFSETIQRQYQRREKLWENPYILPDFNLRTVKAVQTIAGQIDNRFDNWFKALDYMTEEALKEDFDIAIIACGAYGMPLGMNLKRAGKQVLHWGGISQIWFGIKGGRWDNNPRINQYYNEYWVRPSNAETPQFSNAVEGGCYW